MDELKELVNFIDKKKLRHVETLNHDDGKSSIYREMYYLISNNEVSNENELAQKIAGTNKQDKKYGMLKSRFRKRLYNHILFIDLSKSSSELKKLISNAYKQIYIAKLLQINSQMSASYKVVKKITPILEKYELHEPLITAYQIKLNSYSQKGQIKKLKETSNLLIKTSKRIVQHSLIVSLYEKTTLLYNKAEIMSYNTLKSFNEIVSEVNRVLLNEKCGFNTKWLAYIILCEFAEYCGDFETLAKGVNKLEQLLEEKPHFKLKVKRLFILSCKLALGMNTSKSKDTIKSAVELSKLYEEGSFNWFFCIRKTVYYYASIENYKSALQLTDKVVEHENFKKISNKSKEAWLLWHAYLLIFNANYDKDALKKIKLPKILNSVSTIAKDKTGLNTLVRNLEIIYLYLTDNIDHLISLTNSLKIYSSRYLKPNKLRRAEIFTNFIVKNSNEGYLKNAVIANGKFALKKLSQLKNDNPEKIAFEFILYENLIKQMMNK